MTLLVVIALAWVGVVAFTMALLRRAAIADAHAERQVGRERRRRLAAEHLRARPRAPRLVARDPSSTGGRPVGVGRWTREARTREPVPSTLSGGRCIDGPRTLDPTELI